MMHLVVEGGGVHYLAHRVVGVPRFSAGMAQGGGRLLQLEEAGVVLDGAPRVALLLGMESDTGAMEERR